MCEEAPLGLTGTPRALHAGEGFAGWAGMAHLTCLSLQNASMVSDAGCAAIARITSLRTLNLKNCPSLTDQSLAALTPLERLCHLRLQVCPISRMDPYSLTESRLRLL